MNKRRIVKLLLEYGIIVLFLLVVVALSLTTDRFLTRTNIQNILLQSTIIGAIAIGMTFVIISGGIDVSVGSLVAVSSAAGVGLIVLGGAPWWLGMIVMVLTGLLFGSFNGMAVAHLGMPPFLVTLATMGIARGLTLVVSGGRSWSNLPEAFRALSTSRFLGVPMLILVVLLMYLCFSVVLRRTVYGRKVYAVGGNDEAARVSGINVKTIRMSVYMISGGVTGIAAILQTARLNSFWASMGTMFELQAIAIVVIGGSSLSGGIGTIWGTLIGALLMGVINNALNLHGVPANWQDVARGGIIFLAVMLDTLRTRYVINE